MQNHYFDNTHPLRPYTHSLPAMPGTYPPANALRAEEAPAIQKGFWPCEKDGAWIQVEDHCKRDDQEATDYWLPGDTWETPARHMTDVGPLPEGAILKQPEKPIEVVVAETLTDYENRIQARLDAFARTLAYEGIISACTYAASGVGMYRIEGQYCVDARDATWAKAFELLNAFDPAQGIPSWEEIEAQLPHLVWPEGSRGYKEGA